MILTMKFLNVQAYTLSIFHPSWDQIFSSGNYINLLSANGVMSRHVIVIMQWPVCLITSCCSSGLTQSL